MQPARWEQFFLDGLCHLGEDGKHFDHVVVCQQWSLRGLWEISLNGEALQTLFSVLSSVQRRGPCPHVSGDSPNHKTGVGGGSASGGDMAVSALCRSGLGVAVLGLSLPVLLTGAPGVNRLHE